MVTHIHLDHADGAGDIARPFAAAQVVAHERGARHLADLTRLMASARLVYGDELDLLFGTLVPTPSERIRAVDQTGTVDLVGGRPSKPDSLTDGPLNPSHPSPVNDAP